MSGKTRFEDSGKQEDSTPQGQGKRAEGDAAPRPGAREVQGEYDHQMRRILDTLYASVRTLAESLDTKRVAQEITRICVETFGARLAWIGKAEDDGRVSVVAWYPIDHPYPHRIHVRWDDTPEAKGPTGRAIRTGRPQFTRNISADPNFKPWRSQAVSSGFQSSAAYPLISRGRTFGALNIYSDAPDFFDREVQDLFQALANLAAAALENARLYNQVTEINHILRSALKAKEDILRNISHELRTPLTMARGYIELLSTGLITDPDEVQRRASIALEHLLHLQYLIDRLLLLESLYLRRLSMEPLNLKSLIHSVVQGWRTRLAQAGITLHLEIAPDIRQVRGHIPSLRQVLEDLLDNAQKFSPSGGTITVRAWADSTEVYVSVSDTGIGLAQDQLECIFDRFYQVDMSTTRGFSGMGIGLALVKEIVVRHGGRVWAESEGPGKGLTITFTLPLAP